MVYRLISSLAVVASVGLASAQYQAVDLHPVGFPYSIGQGLGVSTQFGYVTHSSGVSEACYWTGTGGSFVSLHDPLTQSTIIMDSDGNQHGGVFSDSSGYGFAALWTGLSGSYINLNPAGFGQSQCLGVGDGQQVGEGVDGLNQLRGLVWSGTAASAVDVTPPGVQSIRLEDCAGGKQVGWTVTAGVIHAGLWSGTAASYQDINPAGSSQSYAIGTDGVTHVGAAEFGGFSNAVMWTSPTTVVDLTPPGVYGGIATATLNGKQVGHIYLTNGETHAVVWSGSVASMVDLHQFLPPGQFTATEAYGINAAGEIIGYGYNFGTGQFHALMWKPLATHTFVGFLQPINDPATPESSFRRGAVIRVQFQLHDSNGDPVTTEVAHISVTHLGAVEAPVNEVDFSMPADDGTQFNVQGSTYSYMLATRNLQSGSRYRITATYGTGSHSVTVAIQ